MANRHTIEDPGPPLSPGVYPTKDVHYVTIGGTPVGHIEADGKKTDGDNLLLLVVGRVFRSAAEIPATPDGILPDCAVATLE